jgi:hypothetical protein
MAIILIYASGEHDIHPSKVKHHFISILKMVSINDFTKSTGVPLDDIRLAFTRENDYQLGPVKNELKAIKRFINEKTDLATEARNLLIFISEMKEKKINQHFVKESYYQALRRVAVLFIPLETIMTEHEEKIKKKLKKDPGCTMTKSELIQEFEEVQKTFRAMIQTDEFKEIFTKIKNLS